MSAELTKPEDMDPLAVLAELNIAKENFLKAREHSKDAAFAAEMARVRLSSMQQQFDALYHYLRSHAPAVTHWNSGPEDD